MKLTLSAKNQTMLCELLNSQHCKIIQEYLDNRHSHSALMDFKSKSKRILTEIEELESKCDFTPENKFYMESLIADIKDAIKSPPLSNKIVIPHNKNASPRLYAAM